MDDRLMNRRDLIRTYRNPYITRMTQQPPKPVFTMGARYEQRKYTVRDLLDLKGQRQLVQIQAGSTEEAAAAEEAGIDMINMSHRQSVEEFRNAAPTTFITVNISAHDAADETWGIRRAYELMTQGADAIMCSSWNVKRIGGLAGYGFPIMGHAGLVPRRSTWTGGLKPVGKTRKQAHDVYRAVMELQEAGCFAVEIECIPHRLLNAITSRTAMVTVSLGSGPGGDVQSLFAQDILGDNPGRVPRHAKAYRNFQVLRQQMQLERVGAFREFIADVTSGEFPAPDNLVKMKASELDQFITELESGSSSSSD